MTAPRRVPTEVERTAGHVRLGPLDRTVPGEPLRWRVVTGVNPDDPELACVAPLFDPLPDADDGSTERTCAPRRRWWHRLTRRNP